MIIMSRTIIAETGTVELWYIAQAVYNRRITSMVCNRSVLLTSECQKIKIKYNLYEYIIKRNKVAASMRFVLMMVTLLSKFVFALNKCIVVEMAFRIFFIKYFHKFNRVKWNIVIKLICVLDVVLCGLIN